MSALLDAFEDLLDAQEDAVGSRLLATVGAVTNKDALVGTLTAAEILVAGGIADSGGASIQMRVSDFGTPPAQLAAVTVKGRSYSLLTYTESHGVYTLTVGDPVADDG